MMFPLLNPEFSRNPPIFAAKMLRCRKLRCPTPRELQLEGNYGAN
jgi:hypothetical protein